MVSYWKKTLKSRCVTVRDSDSLQKTTQRENRDGRLRKLQTQRTELEDLGLLLVAVVTFADKCSHWVSNSILCAAFNPESDPV